MTSTPAQQGLSAIEAATRLHQYGPNQLRPALKKAIVLQFLQHFKNPLVLILLAGSAISALTGDLTGAVIIAVIALMSVTLDDVDAEDLAQPRRWDMAFIRNFMLTIGPISSVFDFLTFYLLTRLFGPDESLFRTGWFVESIATQVLVIFVIRTQRNPLRSQPNRLLAASSIGVVLIAAILPFTPVARALGFSPLPPVFFALLAGLLLTYLIAVEGGKQWFYRRQMKA